MNFNTLEFVFIFLPIVLVLFHIAPRWARLPILCAASVVFYSASGLVPLVFLIVSILWGFFCALYIVQKKSTFRLIVGISVPFLVLYFFKYLDFTLESTGADHETREYFYFFLSVLLPAGISFYTFQIVSYMIDVHDGKVKPEINFVRIFTYTSLYCQLIAGPIVRYSEMKDQLIRISSQKRLGADFVSGLKYFSIGLFGKVWIADILFTMRRNLVVREQIGLFDNLFGIFAYSFQIYYDFWAYSLMAIGLGKMLSIDLPLNFNEPYMSNNPREFWRRWHITLSYWLRDYVYLKLGGNKAYIRNILILFAAVGLWHGAGWSFIVWGLYHALFVVIYYLTKRFWDEWPRVIRITITFVVVSFGWPLFYLDLGQYIDLLGNLVSPSSIAPVVYQLKHWAFLLVVAVWTFSMREEIWLYNSDRRAVFDWPVTHALLCFVAILFFSLSSTFIYFRF